MDVELKRDRSQEDVRGDLHPREDRAADLGAAFAAVHSKTEEKSAKNDEEKLSIFWRVFGGTILSITALVAVTVYNNMATNISELRTEINRMHEARGDYVKKEEYQNQISKLADNTQQLINHNSSQSGSLNNLQSVNSELKEKIANLGKENDVWKKETTLTVDTVKKEFGTVIESVKKDQSAINDGLKKDLISIEALKERVSGLESIRKDIDLMKKDLATLEAIRERLTQTAADIKEQRENVNKIRQDVERNQAGDAERKKNRDEQYAKLLDQIKDLDKVARSCVEKVARMEGALVISPMNPTAPMKAGFVGPIKPMNPEKED
jgi:chromosome segregation ATPase